MTAATMLRTGRATTTATVVPRRAPGFALAAAMLGFAVVALDAQIVNVALPAIRGDLGGGLSGLQWVVTGYTLAFSALQLFAGSVADRVGARRAYGAGMVLFVAASVLCGLAPTLPVLVAARVVQGAGAALVAPTSLALIRETYTGARARGRAIAYWAMGGSVAAAAGPVLGGALTALDWRLTFFVNLPVGALALGVLARVTPSERGSSRFDWTGQVSAVLGLFALTYAVIEGGDLGYGSPVILAAVALTVVALVVFLGAQARGRHPMVPLDLFGSRVVATALVVAFVSMAAFYGVVFLQSLYFQQVRGHSPLATGLLFLSDDRARRRTQPTRRPRRGEARSRAADRRRAARDGRRSRCAEPAARRGSVLLVAAVMVPVGVGGSFTVPPVSPSSPPLCSPCIGRPDQRPYRPVRRAAGPATIRPPAECRLFRNGSPASIRHQGEPCPPGSSRAAPPASAATWPAQCSPRVTTPSSPRATPTRSVTSSRLTPTGPSRWRSTSPTQPRSATRYVPAKSASGRSTSW